ncbi:MAG: hypothetical protein TR69_WS6001000390 [candidate division WS6 bacterium OLB20]|uniref:DUF218 domain-containing protein n=1 Tax=candidate division WS6 bacterium OLB20 TaxID=1617426 RepID=A0A136LXR6_9BACT|nr:MAG: hypothetical protein TR69_WS6001000390 [candidate division WS6 bacterium OLB20]
MNALVIASGGLNPEGSLAPWTQRRADRAIELFNTESYEWVIPASRGTVYKDPPLVDGSPLDEAVAMAHYLIEHAIPAEKILTENLSRDTIGNALFTRLLFTDPLGIKNLTVVTSDFHMPRTRTLFEWVYTLAPASGVALRYENASDDGIDLSLLNARLKKEQDALSKLRPLIADIEDLAGLVRFLYREHAAYSALGGDFYAIDEKVAATY